MSFENGDWGGLENELPSMTYNPQFCPSLPYFEDCLQDNVPDLYESYERLVKAPYEARVKKLEQEVEFYRDERTDFERELDGYRAEMLNAIEALTELEDSITGQSTVGTRKVTKVLDGVLKALNSVL